MLSQLCYHFHVNLVVVLLLLLLLSHMHFIAGAAVLQLQHCCLNVLVVLEMQKNSRLATNDTVLDVQLCMGARLTAAICGCCEIYTNPCNYFLPSTPCQPCCSPACTHACYSRCCITIPLQCGRNRCALVLHSICIGQFGF